MRAYVGQLLQGNSILVALGVVNGAVYSGDVDTPSHRPFIVLRWGDSEVVFQRSSLVRRFLQVWVHDVPNDYVRIDDCLFAIRKLFDGVQGASHKTGHISVIEGLDTSIDLVDDGHKTICRYSNFRLIGTEGNVIEEEEED